MIYRLIWLPLFSLVCIFLFNMYFVVQKFGIIYLPQHKRTLNNDRKYFPYISAFFLVMVQNTSPSIAVFIFPFCSEMSFENTLECSKAPCNFPLPKSSEVLSQQDPVQLETLSLSPFYPKLCLSYIRSSSPMKSTLVLLLHKFWQV